MNIARSIEMTVDGLTTGKCLKHWDTMCSDRQMDTMIKVCLVGAAVFIAIAISCTALGASNSGIFFGALLGGAGMIVTWAYLTADYGKMRQTRDVSALFFKNIQKRK